jgi:hypothetical protein
MIPSEDDIRRRARDIWEFRQHYKIDGTAEGDWLQAEQDLTDDPEYWKNLESDWR